MEAIIKNVIKDSIADELGIIPGDKLLSVDNNIINDILDYKFYTSADEYEIEIEKQNGDIEVIEIINENYEELGLEFENDLLGKMHVCRNKCLFCFIDQLPKHMRKTLYVKDDDYRLSALMGNYVTLTNTTEEDIERIIKLHLPRLNISVHATDKDVRAKLLNNKNSDILPIMQRFAKANIFMDCQIVLCRNINDEKILDKTIEDLAALHPYVQSVSVVPTGLTCHRDKLPKLTPYDKESAEAVILQIEKYQKRFKKELKTNFIYASDEFYVKAKHDFHGTDFYEDFLQLENGVGLVPLLCEEFHNAVKKHGNKKTTKKKTVVSGVSASPYIEKLVKEVSSNIDVVPVTNTLFGPTITVAGLLNGHDIINTLKGRDLGEELLIPAVMINYDGVFLDELCPKDLEKELNIKVTPVENDGEDLYLKLID